MKSLSLLPLLLLAVACSDEPTQDGCAEDAECPAGQFCDAGVCKCRTDDQCGAGRYCNAFGNCQERPPCLGNHDCQSGFICNSADRATGGTCIPDSECGSSLHCAIGTYCRIESGASTGHCTPGCRNTGDCVLGQICVAGACEVAATATDCQLCPTQPDPTPSYCDYGETCTMGGTCEAVPSTAALCTRCQTGNDCASGLVCLLDGEDRNLNYCAPVCDTALDCPNGYAGDCGHPIMVGGPCTSDNDCLGGRCMSDLESDTRTCSFPDSSACDMSPTCDWGGCTPFVACSADADCQALQSGSYCDSWFGACMFSCSSNADCQCMNGRCPVTGMPCSPSTAASDCGLTFVPLDGGPDGVCETNVGTCGKEAGATCEELTGGTATCRDVAAN